MQETVDKYQICDKLEHFGVGTRMTNTAVKGTWLRYLSATSIYVIPDANCICTIKRKNHTHIPIIYLVWGIFALINTEAVLLRSMCKLYKTTQIKHFPEV